MDLTPVGTNHLAVGMLYFQGTHTFAAGMLMSFTSVLVVFLAFRYFVRGVAGAAKG